LQCRPRSATLRIATNGSQRETYPKNPSPKKFGPKKSKPKSPDIWRQDAAEASGLDARFAGEAAAAIVAPRQAGSRVCAARAAQASVAMVRSECRA
jgi:hypothetical protein